MSSQDIAGESPLVGRIIGARYQLRALIGRGGFADVFRAWDDFDDVEVAFKVLKIPGHLSAAAQREFVARFHEEAKLTRKTFNGVPNVRQVLDMGVTEIDGALHPWMAMELLEGETLHEWLRRRRGSPTRLSPPEALELLRPVLTAVGFAHGRGVAHRDLKPANVFLAKPGKGEVGQGSATVVKVLDFGIAKVLQDDAAASGNTMTSSMMQMFSPQYGAPEQFASKKTGKYTDVFALGLIMTELLTDQAPLSESGDRSECMVAALDKRVRPTPGGLGVCVSEALEAVLARAVAFKEADRQADAAELLRDLTVAAREDGAIAMSGIMPVARTEPAPVATSFAERVADFEPGVSAEPAATKPVKKKKKRAEASRDDEPARAPEAEARPGPARAVKAGQEAVPLEAVAGGPAPRTGVRRWGLPLVLALVLVFGGVGGFLAYRRTAAPKLCPAAPRMLAALQNGLHVDAYVTRGTPKLDAFASELTRLLEAYKKESKGRFDYRIIEAKDEEQKKAAKEAGLAEQTFGEAVGDNAAIIHKGFSGLVFKYGSEKGLIPHMAPDSTDGLEFWIINKIHEIKAKAEGISYKLGVVKGHGEMALSEPNLVPSAMGKPNIQQIMNQNFPFYSFVDVDLAKGEVDSALRGMIVTQPETDYTQADLERLDAFVMGGHSLTVVAGAANVKASDPTMKVTLGTHGLERLLGGYGIVLHKDILLDTSRSYMLKAAVQNKPTELRFPFILLVEGDASKDPPGALDARSALFFRLSEVSFPLSSSLDVDAAKQPGARLSVLARTSDQTSRLEQDTVLAPLVPRPPSPTSGPATVAISLEGTLTSAFGHGKSAAPTRVVVIASSQFFANPFARAGNPPQALSAMPGMSPGVGGDDALTQLAGPYAQAHLTSAILVFKNAVDFMTMDPELAMCTLPTPKK